MSSSVAAEKISLLPKPNLHSGNGTLNNKDKPQPLKLSYTTGSRSNSPKIDETPTQNAKEDSSSILLSAFLFMVR